jgi:exodeoxyribonuclease VII large subunit
VKILERGYAIVHDDQGRLVRDAAGVAIGSGIDIKLGKGSLRAEVKRTSASPNEENSR